MFTRKITALVIMSLTWAAQAGATPNKRYLVQFKSTQTFKQVAQNLKSNQFNSLNSVTGMNLMGAQAQVGEALDNLDMMVVSTSDATAVASLKQHPAIAFVEEEIFHPAPEPMATRGNQTFARRAVAPGMEMPWGIKAVKAPEAWTTTKGETVRVMVLDTGLDQQHEAIASRLEKVRNFTGNGPQDELDVTDQVGHGTHVSGTILADGHNNGLVGVAPEAHLLMGKVCGPQGCSSIAIAEGLNWAIDERVDVVNMSLGGMFMSNAEAVALQRAETENVLVIAASGNDGTGSVSFPAAFGTVLAVGAVDEHLVKADFSQWGPQLAIMGPGVDVISSVPRGTGRASEVKVDLTGGGMSDAKSLPFVGSPLITPTSNEVVFCGLGKPEDFASINVRGKYALIMRGEISFKDKIANAIQAGAVGAIVYNNAPGLLQGTLSDDGTEAAIPAAMIEQAVGERAKQALASGQSVHFNLAVNATDYSSFQGTSMATPHVAGVAALVRAANKNLTPAQVREVLRGTAAPLGPNPNNEYGSGMVNAEAAVAKALGVFRAAN